MAGTRCGPGDLRDSGGSRAALSLVASDRDKPDEELVARIRAYVEKQAKPRG
jgi:hypothetical protein